MKTIDNKKGYDKILRRLFRKAEVSYTVSDISKALGPMIDLVFISQFIGTDGVTVIGYVGPLIMLFELVGTTISSGARNKVSSLIGAGKQEEADRAFSGSLFSGAVLSLFMVLLVSIFCSGVSMLLGARAPGIMQMTFGYIYGYLIGFPFFALTRILTPYLQIEGKYPLVTGISLLTTGIDVAADAFVVFVLYGGMFEIGLATSLGYIVPFFFCVSYFLRRKNRHAFHFSFRKVDPVQCLEILKIGAPAGIVKTSSFLGGILINNMLTAMSTPYLVAAYGVFSQITVFVRSSWYAPADSLQAFTGLFIGEEDRESLKEVQKLALIHGLFFTGFVMAVLFAFAGPAASVLMKSEDPAAMIMSVECIRVACLSLPFHAIVYSFNNYLMVGKRPHFCRVYSFLIECGVPVPVTLLTLLAAGYHGAWISKPISMAVLSALAIFYISRNRQAGSFREKMLLLPETFGVSEENELAIIATSVDEIQELSHIAVAFALEHEADRKRARTYGLLVEELAIFLSEHGFVDGKPHNIYARLVAKDADLIIRLRDDCKPLNLIDYYEAVKADCAETDEPGLSIIMKIAREASYCASFGVNNLIVRI